MNFENDAVPEMLSVLCKGSLERDMYIYFLDHEKPFDRVNWSKLIIILKGVGVVQRDMKINLEFVSGTVCIRQAGRQIF